MKWFILPSLIISTTNNLLQSSHCSIAVDIFLDYAMDTTSANTLQCCLVASCEGSLDTRSGARTSWISLAPASCCQYTRHTQAHTDNDQSDPWQWLSFETEMRGWWAPLLPISGNVLIFPSDFQTGPRLWLSGSMRMVWVRSNTRNILCLLPSLWHKVTANKSELFRSNTSPAWTKLSWLDTGADSSPSLLALLDRYHSRQNVNVMMASLAFSTSPHGSVFLKTIPVSGVTNI